MLKVKETIYMHAEQTPVFFVIKALFIGILTGLIVVSVTINVQAKAADVSYDSKHHNEMTCFSCSENNQESKNQISKTQDCSYGKSVSFAHHSKSVGFGYSSSKNDSLDKSNLPEVQGVCYGKPISAAKSRINRFFAFLMNL